MSLASPTLVQPQHALTTINNKNCHLRDAYWSAQCSLSTISPERVHLNMAIEMRPTTTPFASLIMSAENGVASFKCTLYQCHFHTRHVYGTRDWTGLQCALVDCDCDVSRAVNHEMVQVEMDRVCREVSRYKKYKGVVCPESDGGGPGQGQRCEVELMSGGVADIGDLQCDVDACTPY